MSDSGGGGGGGPGGEEGGMEVSGSAVQNVADVSVLQKHLRKLVPLLLEDGGEAPAVLEAALEEKGAVEHMRKFLSDPQVHTVLVERSTLKGEARAGRPPRCQNGGGACFEPPPCRGVGGDCVCFSPSVSHGGCGDSPPHGRGGAGPAALRVRAVCGRGGARCRRRGARREARPPGPCLSGAAAALAGRPGTPSPPLFFCSPGLGAEVGLLGRCRGGRAAGLWDGGGRGCSERRRKCLVSGREATPSRGLLSAASFLLLGK